MEDRTSDKKKMSVFSLVSDDVVHNILSRLPALSFASAACVNKSWNRVCSSILSRPKLSSALSLNPSLHVAAEEVLDKVLSEPIRPHFAIACIGKQFSLEMTHRLITEKLGSGVPIITNASTGIIGVDALSNQLKEVKWELLDEDHSNHQQEVMLDRGIVLVVGFLPGIKTNTIPLLRPKQAPEIAWVNQFVVDIRNYTALVSDCTSPAGIILFGDHNVDMKPILATIDWALPEETVIVGDASGCFMCGNDDTSQTYAADLFYFDAVALVFARDRNKSPGIGETQFHVSLSTGVIPFGPQLKAVCVVSKDSECSWLTARMDGEHQILDGQGLLADIHDQFEDDEFHDLYIGVMQQRQPSGTSLAYYEVIGGDNAYVVVRGVGIKPGDSFLFYHSDSDTALSSCDNVYRNLTVLKSGLKSQTRIFSRAVHGDDDKRGVFGGFIFSCYLRGESFFGHPLVDSSPFSENFPGVPLAGVFCSGEIGRGSRSSMAQGDEDENSTRCCLHVYSTVYLVMSYVPA